MANPSALYLPGSNHNAATPNTADIRITGDISCIGRIALDNYVGASTPQTVMALWSATSYYSYLFTVDTSGNLTFTITDDGVGANAETWTSTAALSTSDGAWEWIGWTWDASASEAKFWVGGASATASWSQLGAAVTGTKTSIHSSTAGSLYVGAHSAGASDELVGSIQVARLYSGIGANTAPGQGTLVADFRADAPIEPRYRDSTGKIWTLNGSAYSFVEVS